MSERAHYVIQVLEKIGGPLIGASVSRADVPELSDAILKEEAQKIAEMLARSVQMSIDIGQLIDLNTMAADKIEPMRLALTSLASHIIAEHYKTYGQVPADTILKSLIPSLEAVMAFSDNFTPSAESISRLENANANGQAADQHQTNIQYLQAFIPAINAVASFSFGQQEKKLVLDVSNQITKKAKALRQSSFNTTDTDEQKCIELALVKSLAQIFSICYQNKITAFSSIPEPEVNAQQNALNEIWADFDKHAALLESLAVHLVPNGANATANASSSNGPAPSVSAPPVTPPAAQQPAQSPAATGIPNATSQAQPSTTPAQQTTPPPVTPPSAPPPAEQAAANPMGMFAKKPDENATAPPQSPIAPQTQQQPAQSPAATGIPDATSQAQPSAAPAQQTAPPPVAPPAEQAAANPMGMFAKKPDENATVPPQSPIAPQTQQQPAQSPAATGIPDATSQAQPSTASAQQTTPPPIAPPGTPPITPPAEQAPTESTPDDQGDQDDQGGSEDGQAGGPMSFFKK